MTPAEAQAAVKRIEERQRALMAEYGKHRDLVREHERKMSLALVGGEEMPAFPSDLLGKSAGYDQALSLLDRELRQAQERHAESVADARAARHRRANDAFDAAVDAYHAKGEELRQTLHRLLACAQIANRPFNVPQNFALPRAVADRVSAEHRGFMPSGVLFDLRHDATLGLVEAAKAQLQQEIER